MTKRETLFGLLFAFGASLAYGLNAVLIKEGIRRYDVALPGLVVAAATGLLAMGLLSLRSRPPAGVAIGRGVPFILAAGLCAATGIGSYFIAMTTLPVSVVAPISSAYPLVTLVLARIFLRQAEPLRWQTVAGALSVVAGVALIALARA